MHIRKIDATDLDQVKDVEDAMWGKYGWSTMELNSALRSWQCFGLEEVTCERNLPDEYELTAFVMIRKSDGRLKSLAFVDDDVLPKIRDLLKHAMQAIGITKIHAMSPMDNFKTLNYLATAGFVVTKADEESGEYHLTFEVRPAMSRINRIDAFPFYN